MESEETNGITSDISVDRGEEYETLHLAAAHGSMEECKRFVRDVGIDVNSPDAQVGKACGISSLSIFKGKIKEEI